MTRPLFFVTVLCLFASSCTWVKHDPGAEDIELVEADAVADCETLGRTTASVRDRVAAVQRNPGRVREELAALARNSALEMGGDTIVAAGPVDDGQRTFRIYRCR